MKQQALLRKWRSREVITGPAADLATISPFPLCNDQSEPNFFQECERVKPPVSRTGQCNAPIEREQRTLSSGWFVANREVTPFWLLPDWG
jgi:hypothetical protein